MRSASSSRDAPGPADLPPPPWQRPRRVPPRPAITREVVVEAALRVLDAESLEAVSMRRVAQELGTGAASLYAHVGSKQELLDLMFDRVAAEVPLPGPPDPQRWREQVRELAVALHATLARHGDIARVAFARVPAGPNALLLCERLLAILLAGGVPPRTAAWALDRITRYVCGDAAATAPGAGPRPGGELRAYLRSLPAEHFPHTVAHAEELTSGAGAERFGFGLELLLDGLAAQVPAPPRRRAR